MSKTKLMIIFTFIALLGFTPLVIPNHTIGLKLAGLPQTVWTGLLISFLFFILTLYSSLKGNLSEGENNE